MGTLNHIFVAFRETGNLKGKWQDSTSKCYRTVKISSLVV